MFERHPKTTFIGAHMLYHSNDLARLGRLLDRLPDVYPELAAVLAEYGRQPRTAHDFFVKYQDHILFGKDGSQPDEFRKSRVLGSPAPGTASGRRARGWPSGLYWPTGVSMRNQLGSLTNSLMSSRPDEPVTGLEGGR